MHALTCFPLLNYGTEEQRERWLPELLGGDLLGAYCLSEPHAGSDPARDAHPGHPRPATADASTATKAWVTHGGQADFYKVLARTGEGSPRDLAASWSRPTPPGLTADPPEQKMGLTGVDHRDRCASTASRSTADRLIGAEGQGLPIALAALDAGRLGIAAVATGLAQGALDHAVAYAKERETFGQAIIDHQGLGFLLADMAGRACESARATYLDAARLQGPGPAVRHARRRWPSWSPPTRR